MRNLEVEMEHWEMENWEMGTGKWETGKWKVENGKWKLLKVQDHLETPEGASGVALWSDNPLKHHSTPHPQ